jgi:hypothetical protein
VENKFPDDYYFFGLIILLKCSRDTSRYWAVECRCMSQSSIGIREKSVDDGNQRHLIKTEKL